VFELRRHDTFAPDTTMAATTVPTQDNILIPETLLKKRKSHERAREERAITTREKRGTLAPSAMDNHKGQAIAMILTTKHRLASGQCCLSLTIFRE
jgi:hypothetical protein